MIPIRTNIIFPEDDLNEIKKAIKHRLLINVYSEEEHNPHITFNLCPDPDIYEGLDIFIDLDIYQAKLLIKDLNYLVKQKKAYMKGKSLKNQDKYDNRRKLSRR